MSARVVVEYRDHVAVVTLNRAAKRNAVDMAMLHALLAKSNEVRNTRGVRAVVLRGDGPDFCAGIDITMFGGAGIGVDGPDILAPLEGSAANIVQSSAMIWREMPVPVIAVLQGATFGAGLQIAMGTDLRIAAPDARLSVMEIRWGLIPDMALTNTFRHVVRQDIVRDLTYTGRVVDAAEAQALGLVTRVSDSPLEEALEMAADIAAKSPDAMRAAKDLINRSWELEPAAALRLEAELQDRVLAGSNQKEAAHANLEKRSPRFDDPE
jgi:enoyl-CoA hydratase/carnithine racemase